nr:MAG TPA: hypothetical protein [Caudoviricetes sp.]
MPDAIHSRRYVDKKCKFLLAFFIVQRCNDA